MTETPSSPSIGETVSDAVQEVYAACAALRENVSSLSSRDLRSALAAIEASSRAIRDGKGANVSRDALDELRELARGQMRRRVRLALARAVVVVALALAQVAAAAHAALDARHEALMHAHVVMEVARTRHTRAQRRTRCPAAGDELAILGSWGGGTSSPY